MFRKKKEEELPVIKPKDLPKMRIKGEPEEEEMEGIEEYETEDGYKVFQPRIERPKIKKELKVKVVKEHPIVPITRYTDQKTGEEFEIITIEEALTRLLNK